MRRLRAECPWDQEQTHASLTRHLLEEAYETLDALEAFARVEADERDDEIATRTSKRSSAILLFQIVFHAELGDEEDDFNLATIADAVRDKLTGRHPHVFGDAPVTSSDEVAAALGGLKRDEKGRDSVTDGIAWQLPALTLYTKLLRKAALVDVATGDGRGVAPTRTRRARGPDALSDDVGGATRSPRRHVDASVGRRDRRAREMAQLRRRRSRGRAARARASAARRDPQRRGAA